MEELAKYILVPGAQLVMARASSTRTKETSGRKKMQRVVEKTTAQALRTPYSR